MLTLRKSINCKCVGLLLNSEVYSIYLCVYSYASITQSQLLSKFVVHFKVRKCELSNFVLFQVPLLAILGSLHFHINFKISLSISTPPQKKATGIFKGIVSNFISQFGYISLPTVLSVLINEHGIWLFLTSFNNVSQPQDHTPSKVSRGQSFVAPSSF